MQRAFARTRRIISDIPAMSAPNYVGPGDLISGALGFWAFRAYSGATIGNPVVVLVRDSDLATRTFYSQSNGYLNLTEISNWGGAANLYVKQLYNQAASSPSLSHAIFVSPANDLPLYLTNALGTNPAAHYVTATGLQLDTSADIQSGGGNVTQNQPFNLLAVARRTGSLTTPNCIFGLGNAAVELYFNNSEAAIIISAGAVTCKIAAADNAWHAIQAVVNGASSVIGADGATVTADAGAANISAQLLVEGRTAGVDSLTGDVIELGLWPGPAWNATQIAAMNGNQRGSWSF